MQFIFSFPWVWFVLNSVQFDSVILEKKNFENASPFFDSFEVISALNTDMSFISEIYIRLQIKKGELKKTFWVSAPLVGNACYRCFSKTLRDRDLKLLLMSFGHFEVYLYHAYWTDLTCLFFSTFLLNFIMFTHNTPPFCGGNLYLIDLWLFRFDC